MANPRRMAALSRALVNIGDKAHHSFNGCRVHLVREDIRRTASDENNSGSD